MYANAIRDALYNCAKINTQTEAYVLYGRGIVVGIVSALMQKQSFDIALIRIAQNWDCDGNLDCIPETWREQFKALLVQVQS